MQKLFHISNLASFILDVTDTFPASPSLRCPEDVAVMTELSSGGFGASPRHLIKKQETKKDAAPLRAASVWLMSLRDVIS